MHNRNWLRLALLPLLATLALPAVAQSAAEDDDDPCAGFVPTKRMMNLMVDRMTDDMARQYKMTDDQLASTRQVMKDHLVTFLSNNRDQIRPLMNQFFESQLSGEAPNPEDVAKWSAKALPLLNKLDEQVGLATDKMKEFFNDEQAMKLDGEIAAFRGGMTIVTGKLNAWAEGHYDPNSDWSPPGRQRAAQEQAEAARMQEAAEAAKADSNKEWQEYQAGKPTTDPANPPPNDVKVATNVKPAPAKKDEWEKHVDEFVRKYGLDSDQKQKAYARLHEAQQQRDDYLRSKAGEMDRVGGLLKNAKTDTEKEKAQGEFDKLNAPVARRLEQLDTYLETLPTRKQRQDATKAEPPKVEAPKTEPVPVGTAEVASKPASPR